MHSDNPLKINVVGEAHYSYETPLLLHQCEVGARTLAEGRAEEARGGGRESLKGEGPLQVTQVVPRCLREGEGEVEALTEALKSQEGVRREVAGGHLAVRLLVAARRALALEPPDQEVDAGAAILANTRGAAPRAGGQLAVLTCRRRERDED